MLSNHTLIIFFEFIRFKLHNPKRLMWYGNKIILLNNKGLDWKGILNYFEI